ncbi:hypothetical protein VP01_8404g1, partial [Puccinia sorghi]
PHQVNKLLVAKIALVMISQDYSMISNPHVKQTLEDSRSYGAAVFHNKDFFFLIFPSILPEFLYPGPNIVSLLFPGSHWNGNTIWRLPTGPTPKFTLLMVLCHNSKYHKFY